MNTLLKSDVWVSVKRIDGKPISILNVRLKSPKESRVACRMIVVEVFENKTKLCPVVAYLEYRAMVGRSNESQPAFRSESGFAYRHQQFNKDLKELLGRYITYGKISAHSFRSGLASLMAQAGCSVETIKAVSVPRGIRAKDTLNTSPPQVGRWSSDAFLCYIKLQRTVRVAVAAKLSSLL